MTERWPRPDPHDDGEPIGALRKDHVDSILQRLREHQSTRSRHVEGAVLGQGGMGIVLEVRDADLRRPLALKRLHPKRTTDVESDVGRHYLARFLQEAQVTGQLAHPGIPPVHELSIDDKGPFFTMPVIRGQNLDEVFEKARRGVDGWSLARALGVLLKVCEAMAFAHAKRVVHRDLKPENVRIGRFGEVYVMDWGLARVLGSDEIDLVRWSTTGALTSVHTDREDADDDANAVLQTLDGDVLGTPFYMAPEQARGELASVGARTDIYAVGGLLYLLLTGRAPYQPQEGRISSRTVLGLVLHGAPARVVTVSPTADADLIAICEKAMSRRIEGRYASMEELAADLEAWIDRRPIRASEPSASHALRLFAERHRSAVTTAAAGLIALIGAGAWFTLRVTKERDEKESARADAQRRGDAMAAVALQTRETGLWPVASGTIADLERWLADAADLHRRIDDYRVESSDPSITSERRSVTTTLLSEAARLDPLRAAVQRRLDASRRLATVVVEQKSAWDTAIADMARSAKYAELRVEPRPELAPLRKDAQSGLWEFWHVPSGDQPDASGPRAQDGLTFVLVPGGESTRYPPNITAPYQASTIVQTSRMPGVYASKYEVTQAQWERVMGLNPALHQSAIEPSHAFGLTCPVESVTHLESVEFARRLGAELPDEWTWEWLALGGRAERLLFVDDPSSVEGRANVRDRSTHAARGQTVAAWDDQFPTSAPIGSFLANGYGLHDMLGNVSEWTSSTFEATDEAVVTRIDGPPFRRRVIRGGSFYFGPELAEPRVRQYDNERGLNQARGLRVVLAASVRE